MRRVEHLTGRVFPVVLLVAASLWLGGCALRTFSFDPDRHGRSLSEREAADPGVRSRLCRDFPPYIPDESANGNGVIHRTLRVNYHYVNARDSSHNFNAEVGTPFAYELTREINKKLAQNIPMSLPAAKDVPVLPTRMSLVITPMAGSSWDDGVYYHYDDELYAYVHKGAHRNNSDRRVIERYAIRPDSVINIFILPHHPDSVGRPTYPSGGVGIALGTSIKISGVWEHKLPPSEYAGMTLHEVGHILGLAHTWQFNDGCDDTPHHPNCFNVGEARCGDTLLSNNVMDYNTWQQAWTPCQLGKAHRNLARVDGAARRYVVRDWCMRNPEGDIRVTGQEIWDGERDLQGHLDILPGATLSIRCRVSLPEGAALTVHPGGTLILDGARIHNDCGLPWAGIRLMQQGRRKGKVYLGKDWRLE